MRIFCGLTNIDDVVAAALVNERGGVIATAEVTDDPLGYVALCRMWVRHSDLAGVSVADDGSTQTLTMLARAAGQPTAATKSGVGGSENPLDTAVHIARLLATGELAAAASSGNSAPPLRRLVISVHALTEGAHAGQGALIELLRQCHPAALSAWDDPTDPVALELLRAIPEPADAAGADPKRISEQLRDTADPRKISRMTTALASAARTRDYRPNPEVAQAIAAAAESVLAAHAAARSLAVAVTEHLSPSKPAPAAAKETSIPRPRRGDSAKTTRAAKSTAPKPPAVSKPATASKPPLPPRPKATTKPASEPLTVPMPPVRPSPKLESKPPKKASPPPPPPVLEPETGGFPRMPEPETGGFPRMPEPPEFVEPLTTDFRPLGTSSGPDLLSAPVSELGPELEAADDDLLIFSQARSAWFKGPAAIDDGDEAWTNPADEGWRAAAAAVATSEAPDVETTGSGLPRRVPQANLVPGSAIFSDAPSAPIQRDASALARHTAGYFRGWGRARRETVGAGSR